ncbi:hypothetical protein V6N12_027768 [Hibiscus sabdariffa]|uniref:Uncharacterized protein n=1 Tax=Hibiscus sabdariffa TaxID=183260 RepID=A0ABR2F3V7_9ROSI
MLVWSTRELLSCTSNLSSIIRTSLPTGTRYSDEGWYLNASLFLPFVELKSLYLRGNAIAGCIENGGFAKLSSTLNNLEILDLSENHLNDSIMLSLSGISSLRYLNLADNRLEGSSNPNGFQWLSRLGGLETLDLSYNSLENNIMLHMSGLSSLKTLSLSANHLAGRLLNIQDDATELKLAHLEELHLDMKDLDAFSSLRELNLRGNEFKDFIMHKGCRGLNNLEVLDLSMNAFEGMLPHCLVNLTSLRELYVSDNQFSENLIPLANLTSLRLLSLSKNNFEIPTSFEPLVNLQNLKFLYADENKMVMEPSFHSSLPKFQLRFISLLKCITSPDELGFELLTFLHYQYDLRFVDLSENNFNGTVPIWLLKNNTKLKYLIFRGNSFSGPLSLPSAPNLNVSLVDISDNKLQDQIPANICSTFPHLRRLFLSKNAIEGNIPPCLSGMMDLSILDLSNNHLSGKLPEEFIMNSSLIMLRLSDNNLSGNVAPMILKAKKWASLYLDGNNFSGEMENIDVSIFEFATSLWEIDLSNNNLYGKLPRWLGNLSYLGKLALSNNSFEGSIPMEFCNLTYLRFLDLSQNNLSGSIPSCFNPPHIRHVHLHGNRLSGPLSLTFYNSSSLVTLDLRGNNLNGSIPEWIDRPSSLSVLLLKANHLHGTIPIQLCKLYSLSIMDLSQNMFSGPIPSCLGNLTLPMTENKILGYGVYGLLFSEEDESTIFGLSNLAMDTDGEYPSGYMEERIEFTTKSGAYSYGGHILENMTGIDLSSNKLTDQIPYELGNLSQIHSLNLSHNNLIGVIPSSFSKLKQLESLDLSYNNLTGKIPNQLIEMNSLEVFSVAHNNLSGSIPEPKAQFGTFDETSYEGNPLLCGSMLHKSCSKTDSPASNDEEEDSLLDIYVFRVSFLVSYAVMLVTTFVVLYINSYWRRVWFSFVERCITFCRYSTFGNFLAYYIFRRYV